MKTEESQFISLAAAAKMTNYSQDYISLLCRQGKLKAEKMGRNWVTTKEWVYEYVDKTAGKGASVVPVKVKNTKDADEDRIKPFELIEEYPPARRPLLGSVVLEAAIFCTASVILLTNTIGFSNGIREIDDNCNLVQRAIALQNYSLVRDSLKGNNAEVSDDIGAQTCGASEDVTTSGIMAFDIETDTEIIEAVNTKMEAQFSEPIDIVVYTDFAIVNYKSDPEKKFLYVIDGE